jgi:hypothetical protein
MTELVQASQSSREHLKNIEASAKSFESSLGGLKSAAGEVAGALGLAFTVGSVVEGIKAGVEATIAYGKELRDLSEQSRSASSSCRRSPARRAITASTRKKPAR